MARWHQTMLLVSALVGSWLGMQAVHELGHVVGAWLTGGEVARVVLNPLTISRTDLARNPNPLVVVWAGPVFGVLLPLVLWAPAAMGRLPGAFVFRFFAGFCLVANGAYIGAGSFAGIGDCGVMLGQGSPVWTLWLFGIGTVSLGLLLWHGQGANFGLGAAKGRVDVRVAYGTLAACLLLAVLGVVVDGD
jgi:Peptidase M50B-like